MADASKRQIEQSLELEGRPLSPNKAAEIAKLIDDYVKAYQTAELNDRVALSANASARAPRCMVRWRQRVLFLGLALGLNEPHFVGGPFWVQAV